MIDDLIINALAPLNLPVKYGVYTGTNSEYITYQYFTIPTAYGNDKPENEIYYVNVHYFAPLGEKHTSQRKIIKRLLFQSGFTFPDETDASEHSLSASGYQHYVYSCQSAEAIDYGTI